MLYVQSIQILELTHKMEKRLMFKRKVIIELTLKTTTVHLACFEFIGVAHLTHFGNVRSSIFWKVKKIANVGKILQNANQLAG